jgi:orotate phosphoribosyltransferase
MEPLIPTDTELLAGLEMGGIPIATVLSQITGLRSLFVRKTAKTHGTCKLAEGPDFDGKRVLIIEDIVSSGGQIVLSTSDLRQRGAVVSHALCAIDRESGGAQNLADAGIALHSVFRAGDLNPR